MESGQMKKNIFRTLFKKGIAGPFQLNKKKKEPESLSEADNNKEYSQEYSEEEMLIQNIRDAKNEWLNADMNFQYVSEDEFIEYYTYKLKAAQIKYEFFLRKAKEKGIKVNLGASFADRETDTNQNKNIDTNANTYINNISANSNTNITTKLR